MISVEHGNNKLILTKETNIKLNIEGTDRRIYRAIFYKIKDSAGREILKSIYDSSLLSIGWSCMETLDHTSNDYPIEISIHLRGENGWFSDFLYNKNDKKFYKINNIRNTNSLDKVGPPVIITGAPGGGTSYIAKILKHCGLYFGADSGGLDQRKSHESVTFTTTNHTLFFRKGNFLSVRDEDGIEGIKMSIKESKIFYTGIFKNHLEYKFDRFWGNMPHNVKWGWKDPGVSITLPVWKNIFPECKLIIIHRSKNKISQNIHDVEGSWFREEASEGVIKSFLNPDISGFSEDDIFYCDFSKVVESVHYMNKMLEWIGLDTLKTITQHKNLLKDTGYEGRI